jgi:hypothetical protein
VRIGRLIAPVALGLTPIVAEANAVWPAVWLAYRLWAWWAILAGLVIEFAVYREAFSLPPRRAALAAASANVVSAIAGAAITIAGGLAWEFGPGQLVNRLLDYGTFNPISWAATLVMAAAANAAIELYVLWVWFRVPFTRRAFTILALANAVTVSIALGSLAIAPIE